MFRKLAIAVITAWTALLETVADAIAATLPPPAADSPRLRVVASGRLCPRLLIVSPSPRLASQPCRCQYAAADLTASSETFHVDGSRSVR